MARKAKYVMLAIFGLEIAFSNFLNMYIFLPLAPYDVAKTLWYGTETAVAIKQDIDLSLAVTRRANKHI